METFGIVVASIVGFIAFFFVFLSASSFRMRRAAMGFLHALRERRYSDAHKYMGKGFKASVAPEEFERFLGERGVFAVKEVKRYLGDYSIGSNQGSVKPWIIREDNVYFQMELHMLKEDGSWKVAAIDARLRLMHAPAPVMPDQHLQQSDQAESGSGKSLH